MTTAQVTSLAELKQTSKMVARDAGVGSVKKFFESQKSTLLAVLPKHMDAERMLKIALGAMRTTPKLMNCTVESLFGAVVQCSQLGLEPNTPLGHAYLIPFDNRQKGVTEVQIVFGYKGLIDLSRRSGQIVSITAHEVCEKDTFDFAYGLNERLDHKPALGERGQVIAFYAVAKLVGGGYAFEVMSKAQIEEIRDASQNYKFARDKGKTVWGQHFVEMGRKTVLRRLFKYLPVSIEVATAAALEGRASDGHSQGLDNVLTGEYSVVDDEAPQTGQDEGGNEDQQQLAAPEGIDTETGEILAGHPLPNAGMSAMFGLEDALQHVKRGDLEMARDISRGLVESDQRIVEQTIANQQQPAAGRQRRQRDLE
ncbi:recombination protein RecT [Chromobacterium violaceum]|uniref:Recombinase RecT n=1 Tax=Chromobacterium violaceum TaxID=536 RepID=A0A202B560_CHRVL|nr:recombination protein RecT [Chromobacterium violaceum]OVE46716.1 recombinase RecT [Chromobacterium violaceum]